MNQPDISDTFSDGNASRPDLWQLARYAQIGSNINSITHEVNNWLGAVLAYTELVQANETLSGDSNRMLEEVKGAVEKSSQLLGTMTTVARIERDTKQIVDMRDLLIRTVSVYDFEMKKNRVQVSGNYDSVDFSMEANEAWVQRVLMYVLSEAMEQALSSPVKSIRINVEKEDGSAAWTLQPVGASLDDAQESFNLSMAKTVATLVNADVSVNPESGFRIGFTL